MRYFPALTSIVLLATLSSTKADWPQWRGPSQSGHVPTKAWTPTKLPASAEPEWKIKLGDGLGSPVVADGKVFYLDHEDGREVVHAVRVRNGKESWKTDLDEVFKDGQSKPGPRSTPVVHDGLVYVQSCRGQFKCLKASNGKEVWSTHFVKDFKASFIGERGKAQGSSRHGNCGSPVIHGDNLYVAVGGADGAGIVCFNRKTGEEIWRSQSDVAGYGPVLYTTLAGKEQIIHFTINGVMGLDPTDGKLLWKEPESTTFGRHVITPIIYNDMIVISTHSTGIKGIKIKPEGDGFKAELIWTNKKSAINISSPVSLGKYLYGVGPKKNFICVDIETGEEQWSKTGLIKGADRSAYAGLMVMEDRILTLTDGGMVVLFKADPKEYTELGRAQACGSNWCNPAYSDGQLYLRDGRSLYRLNLK